VREQPDQVLAVQVKRLREDRKITQEQLAFDAGITASALSRIERGINNPGWMTVRGIARALSMTLLELVTEVDGPETVEESEQA
jgi:transcriptional regulator with XRE-family HTH domain